LPRFGNLAELDFYIYDIPAHTAGTWETNEIPLPSDVDVETEALVLYGIEHVLQDASVLFADTATPFIRPYNFHLIEPADENDLETCFMSKMVMWTTDETNHAFSPYQEGPVTPMVPIVIITGFYESADVVNVNITANDEAFRIWYDDVPLTQNKMAQLVNILRGEQV
jgi:hypothetical protein